jgi:hypothetical protein
VGHPGTPHSRNKQGNESNSDKKIPNSVVDKWVKYLRTIMLAVIDTTRDIEIFYIGKCKFKTKISPRTCDIEKLKEEPRSVEDSDASSDSLSERDMDALHPHVWESPEHLTKATRLAGMSDGQDKGAAQFMTGMLIYYKVSRLALELAPRDANLGSFCRMYSVAQYSSFFDLALCPLSRHSSSSPRICRTCQL